MMQLQLNYKSEWYLCIRNQMLKNCIFYKVTYNCCDSLYIKNTKKTQKTEQHFQYVDQNVLCNKNVLLFFWSPCPNFYPQTNLITISHDHYFQDFFHSQNSIGSTKIRGKVSCTLCMKERTEIIDWLWCRYGQ